MSNLFEVLVDKSLAIGQFTDMRAELDRQKVKEKAVELAFAARTVIQQLAAKDRTPEGLEAQDILEQALTKAIPDGLHQPDLVSAK